jgi:DNA-binding transcriptional MocR family regulator
VLDFERPSGGFFLWTEIIDPAIDPAALLTAAAARGLILTAGRNFAATGGSSWDRRLRLAYSSPPIDHLTVAVDRLADAVSTLR